MKYMFLFLILLIAQYYGPWYMVAIVPFIICSTFQGKPVADFLFTLLTVFILWFLVALFKDFRNQSLLSFKIAGMFHLHSTYLLIIVCSLTGAVIAGLGALSGNYFRDLLRVKQ